MKVSYDREVDALYVKIGSEKPDGVSEISDGVSVDLTEDGRLVGIEILDASKRLDLKTILNYSLDLKEDALAKI